MDLGSNPPIYETIGRQYVKSRRPDPRIARQIHRALGDARSVCNVGAGSGSYEPIDRQVVAVEPSQTMIDQRRSSAPVVKACAEDLPFADQCFDAAMTVLSVHHWQNPVRGLRELKRIARRQVVFAFDPDLLDQLWLVRDYLPEIIALERDRAISIETIAGELNAQQIIQVAVPHDCQDGFQAAFWRRPEEYLRPEVQASISTLAQLPPALVNNAMQRLERDLASGAWESKYQELLCLDEHDFGYRLVVAAA